MGPHIDASFSFLGHGLISAEPSKKNRDPPFHLPPALRAVRARGPRGRRVYTGSCGTWQSHAGRLEREGESEGVSDHSWREGVSRERLPMHLQVLGKA